MLATELEYIICPLCKKNKEEQVMLAYNTHGSHAITDESFPIVQCKECELVYINPRPKQSNIGKFYNIDYYVTGSTLKITLEKFITKVCNLRKIGLLTKFKKSGRLLDIGCGSGNFLLSVPADKWDIYGIEPNKTGFELSNKKVKGNIFNNNLNGCKFQNSHFDIITMWHVFEHMYNPNEELQEIRRILKDDGVFVLAIPNINSLGYRFGRENWFHLDSPRHLYHYNTKNITGILNKNGFSVLKVTFPFFEYPLDLFHSLKNSYIKNNPWKRLLTIPLFFFSLLAKPIASIFKSSETMVVFCKKGDSN